MSDESKKCRVCGSEELILMFEYSTSWGTDVSGGACCSSRQRYVSGVVCWGCKLLYHVEVLGEFLVTSESPYWKPEKGEKCSEEQHKAD